MRHYEEGRITATGLFIDLLNAADQDDLSEILGVPAARSTRKTLRAFIETYRPEMGVCSRGSAGFQCREKWPGNYWPRRRNRRDGGA